MAEDYTRVSFKAGDSVFQKNQEADYAYIVESGRLKILNDQRSASPGSITMIERGGIIGEMALLGIKKRLVTVVCVEDSTLLQIERSNFLKHLSVLDNNTLQIVKALAVGPGIPKPKALKDSSTKLELDENSEASKNILKTVFKDNTRNTYDFKKVDLLLAMKNVQTRQGIKGGLFQHGFRDIEAAVSISDFKRYLEERTFDLLIFDTSFGLDETCSLIHKIRHNEASNNPFKIIICIIEDPDQIVMNKLIDAGCDDIILKPVSLNNLLDRIERMIHNRKPFVVTCEYIGPDRRKTYRADTNDAPKIIVPNPLKAKAYDGLSSLELQNEVIQVEQELNILKLERLVVQIEWQFQQMTIALDKGRDCNPFWNALSEVMFNFKKRANRTDFSNHEKHYQALEEKITSSLEKQTDHVDLVIAKKLFEEMKTVFYETMDIPYIDLKVAVQS